MRHPEDLQVILREQLRRLMAVGVEESSHEIRLVTAWIEQQPVLRAILADAERAEPGLDPLALVYELQHAAPCGRWEFRWPSQTENGRAHLIWQLMRGIAARHIDGVDSERILCSVAYAITGASSRFEDTQWLELTDSQWQEFARRILRPLFDYLDERVSTGNRILYVLERYVRRVEWFDRDELHRRMMEDTRRAEDIYDTDLRRFLFSEGIDMPFSQAKSASGESDVLADLGTDDPLVCELKIFDADSRRKRYLASGVHQAISYASDYGKQVAYLVIINLSGRPLSLPSDDDPKLWPPRITVAGTRVYLVAVRALPPTASASKLGRPAPVIVTHDDLVNPDALDEEPT